MINSNTKSISLNDLGIRNATIRYQLSSTDLHQEILTKKQGQECADQEGPEIPVQSG